MRIQNLFRLRKPRTSQFTQSHTDLHVDHRRQRVINEDVNMILNQWMRCIIKAKKYVNKLIIDLWPLFLSLQPFISEIHTLFIIEELMSFVYIHVLSLGRTLTSTINVGFWMAMFFFCGDICACWIIIELKGFLAKVFGVITSIFWHLRAHL